MAESVGRGPTDAASEAANKNLSTLERALDIIGLFADDRPLLTLEEIVDELRCSRSSCYRYVKALCHSGLLAKLGKSRYRLGPHIIELERRIRLTDPLLQIGERQMEKALKAGLPDDILLLCSLYRDRVLCIHQAGRSRRLRTLHRTRGVPFPLFDGPASLVILAHLPGRVVQSLYLKHSAEIAFTRFAHDWHEFRAKLRTIKRNGYFYDDTDPVSSLGGLAVAVFDDGQVVGSLTLVREPSDFPYNNMPDEVARMKSVAKAISNEITALVEPCIDGPLANAPSRPRP